MVFNNPEFTEFNEKNDKMTTSSMDDDDIYDWSRNSLTPSNQLTNKQNQLIKLGSSTSLNARFSSGYPQAGQDAGTKLDQKRESLGEDNQTPKGAGSSQSLQEGGFGKFIQQNNQGRRSGGRTNVFTPENKPRGLDKKSKFIKAQSFLGFLNEIQEVEEDERPKIQTPVIYSGILNSQTAIKEQSKESTDPNDSKALYISGNMDEHAQRQRALNKILLQHKIEQSERERQEEQISEQKR